MTKEKTASELWDEYVLSVETEVYCVYSIVDVVVHDRVPDDDIAKIYEYSRELYKNLDKDKYIVHVSYYSEYLNIVVENFLSGVIGLNELRKAQKMFDVEDDYDKKDRSRKQTD